MQHRFRSAALLLLVATTLAWSQNNTDAELREAAKSPYAIARFIRTHTRINWEPLWKSLGLGSEDRSSAANPFC